MIMGAAIGNREFVSLRGHLLGMVLSDPRRFHNPRRSPPASKRFRSDTALRPVRNSEYVDFRRPKQLPGGPCHDQWTVTRQMGDLS